MSIFIVFFNILNKVFCKAIIVKAGKVTLENQNGSFVAVREYRNAVKFPKVIVSIYKKLSNEAEGWLFDYCLYIAKILKLHFKYSLFS